MITKLKGFEDSVLFREDIRVVYKFPLMKGKSWTSFTYPFLQTREVVGWEFIRIKDRNFMCYNILTKLPEYDDIKWNDYVSSDGLIKRSIEIDSIEHTTVDKPEGTGRYFRFEEKLELIN